MGDDAAMDEAARAAEGEVRGLLERARGGDASALPALRAALDGRPELWRAYGDLEAHARSEWIARAAGPDLALRESLARAAGAMLADLAGPGATALERLLAGRVVSAWVEAAYCDAMAARVADGPIRLARFAARRQASASSRLLAATSRLATVRRLLPPAAAAVPTPPGTAGDREPGPNGGDDARAAGEVIPIGRPARGRTGPGSRR